MQRILKHPFIRGGAIFSGASFIVSVLNYLFNLLVARSFLLADYGEYMAALSYVAIFSVPFGGITMILIQKIGLRSPKDRINLVMRIEQVLFDYIKRHAPVIIGTAVVFFGLLWWKSGLQLSSIVLIIALICISVFTTLYSAALQALKRFSLAGLLSIVGSTAKLAGYVIVILLFPKILGIYGVLIAAGIVTYFFGRSLVQRENRSTSKSKPIRTVPMHLATLLQQKPVLLPMLTNVGLVGMLSIDVILVKKFLPADATGYYAAISLLAKIILYLAAPLGSVAFTFFTGSESRAQRSKVLLLTLSLLLAIGFGSIALYLISPALIIRIIFGAKFLSIAPVIWLAAVFGLLYSLVNVFAQYWIARQNWLATMTVGGFVAQTIGITLFHANFYQVLVVNIAVAAIVLVVYSLPLVQTSLRRLQRL